MILLLKSMIYKIYSKLARKLYCINEKKRTFQTNRKMP